MSWVNRRLIYGPKEKNWWTTSHCHIPTVDLISDDTIRVYFASLDSNKFGRVGYVDLEANNPEKVIDICKEPVLDIGALGNFDDCGVIPSCVINKDDNKLLYYIGFQRCERVPYMIFSGAAHYNNDAQCFERVHRTPMLDRTPQEPYSRAAPFVMFDEGQYRIWYWSCTDWATTADRVHYKTVIKTTTSTDGLNWSNESTTCLEPAHDHEFSVGRPWIVKHNGRYHMWFSARAFEEPYRICYAHSEDGLHWERQDDRFGLMKSASGWDSEMVCYPSVVALKDTLYLFYNGNNFGEFGFGMAECKMSDL